MHLCIHAFMHLCIYAFTAVINRYDFAVLFAIISFSILLGTLVFTYSITWPRYIRCCSVQNLYKLINILYKLISYQEKKTIYIPLHTLPNPSHLQKLLSLIHAFLIITCYDEGSTETDSYHLTDTEWWR